MDFRFKVMGDRLRGISLGSSGDPIIHMWIMDGCVCVYTVRVVSLCVLGVFLSLLLPGSSRQAGPGTEGACARLSPTRRTEARGLLGLADGAYGGARPGEGPGGGSCSSSSALRGLLGLADGAHGGARPGEGPGGGSCSSPSALRGLLGLADGAHGGARPGEGPGGGSCSSSSALRGRLGLADGAYGGARPGEGPGGGSCLYLGVRTTAATPNGGGFVKASRRSERRTHGLGCSMAP
jgi:hypothetical protein